MRRPARILLNAATVLSLGLAAVPLALSKWPNFWRVYRSGDVANRKVLIVGSDLLREGTFVGFTWLTPAGPHQYGAEHYRGGWAGVHAAGRLSGTSTHRHAVYVRPWLASVAFLTLALPGVSSWVVTLWRRRPPPPGRCRCGYDLTGNVSGVCPECGTAARVTA